MKRNASWRQEGQLGAMARNSPSRCNILEILLSDPGIPMCLQGCCSLGPTLVLAEGVFIDDSAVASRVKKRGGDPGLGSEVVETSKLL